MLEVKGWKKIFHANSNQKKAGVAILISNTIDFESKKVYKNKEGTIYSNRSFNSVRWYNNYKYISTGNRPEKYVKQKLTELK